MKLDGAATRGVGRRVGGENFLGRATGSRGRYGPADSSGRGGLALCGVAALARSLVRRRGGVARGCLRRRGATCSALSGMTDETGRSAGRKVSRRRRVVGGRQFRHVVRVTPEEEARLLTKALAHHISVPKLLDRPTHRVRCRGSWRPCVALLAFAARRGRRVERREVGRDRTGLRQAHGVCATDRTGARTVESELRVDQSSTRFAPAPLTGLVHERS